MRILGIVTETHDAGLALLEDGVPVLVLEEQRFNREKHTQEFPRLSLEATTSFVRSWAARISALGAFPREAKVFLYLAPPHWNAYPAAR